MGMGLKRISMFKNHRLCIPLLLALSLTGCATAFRHSTQRAEHHYVFGKPPAPAAAPANSGVAPVEVVSAAGRHGPENTAHIVYFDFDAYTVRPSDQATIASHAQWLRNNPQRQLMLQGHTDVRGSTEYNLALGQKRAESVRKSLQLLGVDPSRMDAVSYGKERPADPGNSEKAHQRNRRVEFEYR